MNNAEISTNTPLGVAAVSTLELDFVRLCQVGHGALELRDDCAWSEGTGGKNTELRFARAMRVPLGVGNLNGARREVELHVTGGMTVFEEGGWSTVRSEVGSRMAREGRTWKKSLSLAQ